MKNLQRLLRTVAFLFLFPLMAFSADPPGIPDGWSDGFVYANGIRIHYYHAVPAPTKPTIVMVHGITDNGLCWTTLTWKLQKDYNIYMLDARGHGLSDPFTPTDDRETLVKDVVAFVKAMQFEKPILMGHSMGAATVMRVGADYPDLAQSVIMLDPFVSRPGGNTGGAPGGAARPTPPAPQVVAEGETTPAALPAAAASASPRSAQSVAASASPASPRIPANQNQENLSVNMMGTPETLVKQNNYPFEALVAQGRRQNPKWGDVDIAYWALSKKQYHGAYTQEGSQAMTGTMQTGDALARIPVPSLILKADGSAESRKANEDAVKELPKVTLVHVDGAAHNLHHDDLERTTKEITQFLFKHKAN